MQLDRDRRLRKRRDSGSPHGWNVAAEIMEHRALLSGPQFGTGFSLVFQDMSTPSGTAVGAAFANVQGADSVGNVYISGNYSGTGNVNPLGTPYTLTNATSNSDYGGFLAKYDTNLSLQWALAPTFTPEGSGGYCHFGATVGKVSGDLYVGISVSGGSISLPTVTGTTLTLSDSAYLARLDHNTGNVVWLAQGGAHQIVLDALENVYRTAGPGYTYVYGPGTGGVPVPSIGALGLLKLDSNGNALWYEQFGSGGVSGFEIATDAAGNVYLDGTFSGTADLDPGTTVKSVRAAGYSDIFVEKLNSNGQLIWMHTYGSKNGHVGGSAIGVDVNGNVDAGANGSGTMFTMGTGKSTIGGQFAQFDNNGNMKWVANIYTSHFVLDPAGNIYSGNSKYSPSGSLTWQNTNSVYSVSIVDSAANIWWRTDAADANGQVNVSPNPTSQPIYLASSNTQWTVALVKWTQPGGFAAGSAQQSASTLASTSSLTTGTATPTTANTLTPPVIYVGDVSPAMAPLPGTYDPTKLYQPLLTI